MAGGKFFWEGFAAGRAAKSNAVKRRNELRAEYLRLCAQS